jgi:hypothetical protein
MKWADHVARMGEKRNAGRSWEGGGNLKEIDHLEDLGVSESTVLK